MSKRWISSLLLLAAGTCIADSDTYRFVAADQKPTTRACMAAANGDLEALRDALRDLRQAPHQKHKALINSVRCNGQVAAAFAKTYGATETYDYLYRFTEKRYKSRIPVTGVEDVAGPQGPSREITVHVAGN